MPYFTASDACRLWYDEIGQGAPVVFVHEFGGDHRSWSEQSGALSKYHRCITYAARGFIPSDSPRDSSLYGQFQATGDLLAIADCLALESFHLVGTSMGSFTSLDFTLSHGTRVRSLTLIGNSSGPRNDAERSAYRSDWVGKEIAAREEAGGAGAVAVLAEDPAYRTFQKSRPDAWQTYADRLAEQSVSGSLNILRTLHWNRRSLWDDEARLRLVDCPVLLVYGCEDYYLVGETNAYLSSVIPRATLEPFAKTGHLVNLERPDEFNALLRSNIAMVEKPGKSEVGSINK